MRFAISVVAGAAGLTVLALGVYGDPALYWHEARVQWDELMDIPATGADDDAGSDQVDRLRQQIALLESELAARPVVQGAAAPVQSPWVPSDAPEQPSAPAVDAPQPAPPPVPRQSEAAVVPPVAVTPEAVRSGTELPDAPPPRRVDIAKAEVPRLDAGFSEPAATLGATVPPRAEPVAAEPRKVASLAPEQAKPDAARPEAPRPEAAKAEPAKPAPRKPGIAPPLPVRQETDDAQSVLARLRQAGPVPVRAPDPPQSVEPSPRSAPSPFVPRLTAAKSALAAGRVEDARRMLQEAQLQLVFRPVDLPGDDQPLARGASDVARALEALSANNTSLGRRFIDGAIDDLSGTGPSQPVQDVQLRPTGYAPAYPPR